MTRCLLVSLAKNITVASVIVSLTTLGVFGDDEVPSTKDMPISCLNIVC